MNILIDADGCPVVNLTLQIAKQFSVPVIILCDTSHQIEREGAQTLVFDKAADSVDFALVNRVKPGDIVVYPCLIRNPGFREDSFAVYIPDGHKQTGFKTCHRCPVSVFVIKTGACSVIIPVFHSIRIPVQLETCLLYTSPSPRDTR